MMSHLHQILYLKVVKCGCSEEIQYRQYNFACSVFCTCQGGHICFNNTTRQTFQADDDDDDDVDDGN